MLHIGEKSNSGHYVCAARNSTGDLGLYNDEHGPAHTSLKKLVLFDDELDGCPSAAVVAYRRVPVAGATAPAVPAAAQPTEGDGNSGGSSGPQAPPTPGNAQPPASATQESSLFSSPGQSLGPLEHCAVAAQATVDTATVGVQADLLPSGMYRVPDGVVAKPRPPQPPATPSVEHAEMAKQLDAAKSQLQQLQNNNSALGAAKQQALNQVATEKAERARLQDELAKAQKRITDVAADRDSVIKQAIDREAALGAARDDRAAANAAAESQRAHAVSLERDRDAIKTQLTETAALRDDATKQLAAARADVERLQGERDALAAVKPPPPTVFTVGVPEDEVARRITAAVDVARREARAALDAAVAGERDAARQRAVDAAAAAQRRLDEAAAKAQSAQKPVMFGVPESEVQRRVAAAVAAAKQELEQTLAGERDAATQRAAEAAELAQQHLAAAVADEQRRGKELLDAADQRREAEIRALQSKLHAVDPTHTAAVKQLEARNDALASAGQKAKADLESLRGRLAASETARADAKALADSAVAALRHDLNATRSAAAADKEQASLELAKARSDAVADKNAAAQRIQLLENDVSGLTSSLAAEKQKAAAASHGDSVAVISIKGQLQRLQATLDNERAARDAEQRAKSDVDLELTAAQHALSAAQKNVATARADAERSASSLAAERTTVNGLKQQLAERDADLKKANAASLAKTQTVTSHEATVRNLRDQLSEAQAEVEELQAARNLAVDAEARALKQLATVDADRARAESERDRLSRSLESTNRRLHKVEDDRTDAIMTSRNASLLANAAQSTAFRAVAEVEERHQRLSGWHGDLQHEEQRLFQVAANVTASRADADARYVGAQLMELSAMTTRMGADRALSAAHHAHGVLAQTQTVTTQHAQRLMQNLSDAAAHQSQHMHNEAIGMRDFVTGMGQNMQQQFCSMVKSLSEQVNGFFQQLLQNCNAQQIAAAAPPVFHSCLKQAEDSVSSGDVVTGVEAFRAAGAALAIEAKALEHPDAPQEDADECAARQRELQNAQQHVHEAIENATRANSVSREDAEALHEAVQATVQHASAPEPEVIDKTGDDDDDGGPRASGRSCRAAHDQQRPQPQAETAPQRA